MTAEIDMDVETTDRCLFAQCKGVDGDGNFDAVASTNELDRHDEIINPESFRERIDAFMANPVMLAGHQHRLLTGHSPVIGSFRDLRIEDTQVSVAGQFAQDVTELAAEYAGLYRSKHQRAFSVGFIPLKWEFVDQEEPSESKPRRVLTHTEIELLEISAVAVPANRYALMRSKALQTELLQGLRGQETDFEPLAKRLETLFESLRTGVMEAITAQRESLVDDISNALDALGVGHDLYGRVDDDTDAGTGECGAAGTSDDEGLVGAEFEERDGAEALAAVGRQLAALTAKLEVRSAK